MNFKLILAALAVTAMPISASALTLTLTDNTNVDGPVSITDGVGGDVANNQVNYVGEFGGFSLTIATGVVAEYPPIDKLFANLNSNVLKEGINSGDVTLEVSHVFTNPASFEAGGYQLSQDLNTLTGAGAVETFYGTALFDKSLSLDDILSNLNSASSDTVGTFATANYSITHVINVNSSGCPDCTLQGSADIVVNPVPVPAGILLMGTAIAGFGVMRRRKKAA